MARDGDDRIKSEIRAFSIQSLGWDPESATPSPRDDLQWVRQQRERAESSRKWRGTVILTVISALIAAIVGGLGKEIITWVSR